MLTLHHLETSRSSRAIWLLEALGVDYELVTYKRGPDMRAPASLAAIHPLAKAPTIVDGDLVLTESSAVLRHIAERHGGGRFMPLEGSDARSKHDEWLDYAESSLMGPLMTRFFGGMTGGLPPAMEHIVSQQLAASLTYISDGVGEGPFLMGDELTVADMQMSYCLAALEAAGLLADRPKLAAYWARLQAEPSFQRTLEVGGPLMMQRPASA
jgi:glutathione S-transferase